MHLYTNSEKKKYDQRMSLVNKNSTISNFLLDKFMIISIVKILLCTLKARNI